MKGSKKEQKRKARKAKYLAEKKQKLDRREELQEVIKTKGISGQMLELMSKTAKLGQKDTLKETLGKDLVRLSLGMPVKRLVREVEVDEGDWNDEVLTNEPVKIPKLLSVDHQSSPQKVRHSQVQPKAPGPPKKVMPSQMALKEPAAVVPSVFRPLNRPEAIETARRQLPILNHEQEIMEAINNNLFTIVCGETGSGKSTQVPQFLYEAGYTAKGLIGVTQPRRVAAISLATRVADEMGFTLGQEVGYQIRYDSATVNPSVAQVKFMTDGILLREISEDFLLSKYSVVVLDEAHERSINTDILVGLLSRIALLRESSFRLVIMSATLRVEDFLENERLFKRTPPVVNIPARTYPVTVHYTKTTPEDFITEAISKTVKIHRKLPDGGILVFLPGKKDVLHVVKTLRTQTDAKVLSLYSLLSPRKQVKVFNYAGSRRLIVVATNVAETSLTIPNIKYIVDSGREKRKHFSANLQLAKYVVTWVSKASAEQRAGRAGRTCPGHCYRLYSNAAYALHFEEFRPPLIREAPIAHIVLQLKAMGIPNVYVFPFPTQPTREALREALAELVRLGALQTQRSLTKEFDDVHELTEIGREMAKIPLTPRYAKMMALSCRFKLAKYMAVVVAALEVEHIFNQDQEGDTDKQKLANAKKKHAQWFTGKSDALCPLKVMVEFLNASHKEEFCSQHFLNQKSLEEMDDLRVQLLKIVDAKTRRLRKYPRKHETTLLKIVVAGFVDNVACKVERATAQAKRVPYLTQHNIERSMFPVDYTSNREHVFIHPSSYMFAQNPPEFVVYQHMVFTRRPSLINVTAVESGWLYEIGDGLDNLTVLGAPEPEYDAQHDCIKAWVTASFGPKAWSLPPYFTPLVTEDVYYWFLKLLLLGKIVPAFADCTQIWDVKLKSITNRSSSKTMVKVSPVISCLKRNRVYSSRAFFKHKEAVTQALAALVRPDKQDEFPRV